MLLGYFTHVAKLQSNGKYSTLRGNISISPHPTSIIHNFGSFPTWVVYNEIIHSKNTLIRDISRIEPSWLLEVAKHYYHLVK